MSHLQWQCGPQSLRCQLKGRLSLKYQLKGPQSCLTGRMYYPDVDMSDEDRLRNVLLSDYGMATGRELLGSDHVL